MQRAALRAAGDEVLAANLGLQPTPGAAGGVATSDEPDRAAIEDALERNHGVLAQAAAELGLSRQALYRRVDRLGLRRACRCADDRHTRNAPLAVITAQAANQVLYRMGVKVNGFRLPRAWTTGRQPG